MSYIAHLLMLIGIYALLASSLNLTAGFLGLASICQAAFFGLGAYAAGVLLTGHNADGSVVLVVSLLLGWGVGTLLALPLCRLRGDYFAIATFAFQAVASAVFYNLRTLTGGAPGIAGIGPLGIAGVRLTSTWEVLFLVAILLFILGLAAVALLRSPAGRVLATMREDEIGVVAVGLNPGRYRIALFGAGAAVAALSGALYASYMTFIDPTPFGVAESILILCCLVLGGVGSVSGPIIGAVVLVLLPEALRFVGLPAAAAANLRQVVFGTALILLMVFRPSGLTGITTIGMRGEGNARAGAR